jgi:NTE family protein
VLGGGSARGIAHVGILRWLEEHRIPIDVIVGTSMGGLMGGAYATGMTPDEIDALVGDIVWDRMFLGEAPYDVKTIRRKEDSRLYPSRFRFGLKGGLQPPGAIEPGQQINMLLQRITLPYYDLVRFDDLPTPFRSVAVDVRTSSVVVLSEGELWRALRATMAIPGVFSPVRMGDQVLVDGGVLNNLPTDVARALNADVVIAVNVGSNSGEALREPAASYFGALMQTMDLMGAATLARSLAAADVAIRPKLEDIGSLDWRRSDLIIDRGYEAAEAHRTELMPLSVGEEAYRAWQSARQQVRRTTPPAPRAVEIVGVDELDARRIVRRFEPMIGRVVDPARLAHELTATTGTDRFDTASAHFVAEPVWPTMRVEVEPKSYGPPFLLTALDLRNSGETEFEVEIRTRLLAYNVVGRSSELRVDFGIGSGLSAAGQLYKPLFGSPWFMAGDVGYSRSTQRVFVDDEAAAEYRIERTGAALELGYEVSEKMEVRAGIVAGNVDADVRIGDPLLPAVGGEESSLRLRGTYDSMDSPMIPSRGIRAVLDVARYLETADIEGGSFPGEATPYRGELRVALVHTVRDRDRIFGALSGGTAFGDEVSPPYEFTLGGLFRLGAYDPGELRGDDYATAAAGYLLSIGRLSDFLGGAVYLGSWLEAGSVFGSPAEDLKGDLTVGLVAETFLGPTFVGGSIGPDGGRAYITLAPLFR